MYLTLIAFAAYSIAVLAIGLNAARRSASSKEDVHLASREHGIWTSALSTSASTESGFVLLGMVGMAYTFGVSCFWMIPAGILGYVLNWFVLAPRIRHRSEALEAVTIPEYIALSTGGSRLSFIASSAASLFSVIFLLAYVSAQFSAAGKALSSQFPLTYGAGVLVAAGIIAAYAVLGGFRAVSWTDNLQAVMMVAALILLPAIIVGKLNGFPSLLQVLHGKDPALTSLTGGASTSGAALMVIVPWLMIGLGYPGQPHGVIRLMAARDRRVIRIAPYIAILWLTIIYSGAIVLGLAARAGYEHLSGIATDPETALPVLAVELLPGILAGVTLAAIIAAISSTADSTLLSASSTVTRDIRESLHIPRLKNELLVERLVIVTLAALSTWFAVKQTHIVFAFVLYAFFGLGASLGPAIMYCSLISRPRPLPALCGVLAGGILTIVTQPLKLGFLVSLGGSMLVLIIAHVTVSKQGRPVVPVSRKLTE